VLTSVIVLNVYSVSFRHDEEGGGGTTTIYWPDVTIRRF